MMSTFLLKVVTLVSDWWNKELFKYEQLIMLRLRLINEIYRLTYYLNELIIMYLVCGCFAHGHEE